MEWIIFLWGLVIGALGGFYIYRRVQKLANPKTSKSQSNPALLKLERQIINWEQIMQQAPMGYLQVDEENRLCFCNIQACQLLSIKHCVQTGSEKKLLLQIIRSFELDQLIEATRSSHKTQQKEWIFHPTVDDPIHPIEKADIPIKAHSIPLDDGHVGIFIEDRQESVTLAQQRDRWAADVAHDLKTPLTSIRLVAESLQDRVEPDLRKWVETIIKQTIRLSDLVQDILELGQVDMGMTLKLKLETVDLPTIIQSAWHSLEPLTGRKSLKLEYDRATALTIKADESMIYRLLLNLLDNSIKHSPPNQVIALKVALAKSNPQETSINLDQGTPRLGSIDAFESVIIEIIDFGSGFDNSALPHIFDRFYQSAQTDVNIRGGSGLGLAIAHQIVKAHKGIISVDNHPETKGAWVKVILPATQT